MVFGHWSGQNRIGGRVLAMKRRPNDEDVGWEIQSATGGEMKQAGVTSGCNPRKDKRDDSSPVTNRRADRRRREPIDMEPRTLWGIPGRV